MWTVWKITGPSSRAGTVHAGHREADLGVLRHSADSLGGSEQVLAALQGPVFFSVKWSEYSPARAVVWVQGGLPEARL